MECLEVNVAPLCVILCLIEEELQFIKGLPAVFRKVDCGAQPVSDNCVTGI